MSGISLSVTSADNRRSPDEQVNANARRIAEFLHVSAASVFVIDPAGTELRPVAASHPAARDLDARQATLKSGPAYTALQDGAMCAMTVNADARHRWPLFARAMTRSPFTHSIALPVERAGRPVGVMMLYHGQAIGLGPTSWRYTVAKLLAAALVTDAVRARAMRDLENAIAELGALLERVDRIA